MVFPLGKVIFPVSWKDFQSAGDTISHCNQKRCHPFTQFSWPKIQLKTLDGLQKINFEF